MATSTDTVRVATPTGERVTDRENIQAAFDAVQPGGTVIFAAGSYVVGGEGLVLRTPGVALRGDPDGTTLLGCTRTQRKSLALGEWPEFSEACGDGLVLAAEAQQVSDLRFERRDSPPRSSRRQGPLVPVNVVRFPAPSAQGVPGIGGDMRARPLPAHSSIMVTVRAGSSRRRASVHSLASSTRPAMRSRQSSGSTRGMPKWFRT